METYPGELLVGVFPLVFCVDATLASKGTDNAVVHSARSQFDRFLDVMAASLLDEPDYSQDSELLSPNGTRRRTLDDGMLSLFRDGELDSDQEDDMILGGDSNNNNSISSGNNTNNNNNSGSVITTGNFNFEGTDTDLKRRTFPFPRLGREGMASASRNRPPPVKEGTHGPNTSFAKTLQEGQGFFQRARIVSISSRHGFPPSKDPTGGDNRIREYFLGKSLRTSRILAATKRRPIDGILPSGWLEKHAAALPSVILVVVQVSSHQQQHEQNSLLEETVKNLQMSLASKRQCTIRIVGLVQEGISTAMATEWKQTMMQTLDGSPPLTLLDIADLQQDAAPSMTLRTLHKSVHDASLRYYITQARHTKRKLCELGPARGTPLLLPLCIRYCFKVALFYEFQWNPEKSLKYLSEAYRHVETYYRYLLQQREIANSNNDSESSEQDKPTIRLSNHGGNSLIDGDSEGVEMSISNEDDINNLLLNPPAAPDDMVHQCRSLADWINFKILQSCLSSHTESGLLVASAQLQKHVQAFCNPRRSFVCTPNHAYVDWAFVAHQRMVVSQLLERNPPRVLGELGQDVDEVLLRCSRWKTYEAAAEALLRLGAEVRKASSSTQPVETIVDNMRSRYVGGLDKNGFQPKLQEELKINHLELALDCLRRAISFYERDTEKMEKTNPESIAWNRSGARMYYLTSGTLLSLERHAEAATFLQKAVMLVKGWKGLETTIRRMIVECYKKYNPGNSFLENQAITSLLLDSYFNIGMPINDLQLILEKIASTSNAKTLKWYQSCFDGTELCLPFSFTLTFPHATHSTAGDRVRCNLVIKSNLDYAVNINAVTMKSLAGEISIPSADLSAAKNVQKGMTEGVVVEANTTISILTFIHIPKNIMEIALEEPDAGKEKDGSSPRGFLKSARPRTGGMTAAGKAPR